MSRTGYKIIGYVVWREGTWYLRERLPSARTMAAGAVLTVAGVAGAVLLTRRVAGGRSVGTT
jgi:hypothetical protein